MSMQRFCSFSYFMHFFLGSIDTHLYQLLPGVTKWWFPNSIISSSLINCSWNLTVKKIFLFFIISYLFILVWTYEFLFKRWVIICYNILFVCVSFFGLKFVYWELLKIRSLVPLLTCLSYSWRICLLSSNVLLFLRQKCLFSKESVKKDI